MYPKDHMFCILLNYVGTKSFLLFTNIKHVKVTNPVLKQSTTVNYTWRCCRKLLSLTVRLNLSHKCLQFLFLCCNGYRHSCCILSHNSSDHFTLSISLYLKNLVMNRASIIQLTQWAVKGNQSFIKLCSVREL